MVQCRTEVSLDVLTDEAFFGVKLSILRCLNGRGLVSLSMVNKRFYRMVLDYVNAHAWAKRALRTEYTAQNLLASKFTVKLFLAPFHDRFVGEKIVRDETDSAGIRKILKVVLFRS